MDSGRLPPRPRCRQTRFTCDADAGGLRLQIGLWLLKSRQNGGTVTPGGDAAARSGAEDMPSQVSGRRSVFDRFATRTGRWVSKGWFFTICVLVVVLWVPTLWALPSVDTWQLVINTVTTIITFLLVAVLQNTQSLADKAVQQKPNALADALWDLMGELGDETPGTASASSRTGRRGRVGAAGGLGLT